MLEAMKGPLLARSVLVLLLLHLTACSTMQPVNIQRAMHSEKARGVDYGSLVEVRTLDRRTETFRVTEINQEGLGGSPGFFRYADMESLKVEAAGADSGEVWGYVLGILGVVALVAIIANADNVAICSPGPCPEPQ
jgi:hypothetical protein